MKGLSVFLFFCLALASATLVERPHATKPADAQFISRQQNVLSLFYHPYQPYPYNDKFEYEIDSHFDDYTDITVVKHFMETYKQGMLPKTRPFSIMYGPIMNETVALFELFYYAKNFDVFYNTARWARDHVNQEMFIYAYTAALVHRPDCEDFYIPPFYEIFPSYFFSSEVMNKAYKVQMQQSGKYLGDYVHQEGKNVYIYANYSNWYQNVNWEQRLSYFTEDIGLNTYYYNYFMRFPYWMDGEKFKLANRGELFWYVHKQLFARYYMERLSNGMGEIPEFSWEEPIEFGYDPYLTYPNGMNLPSRPNHFEVDNYPFYLTLLEDSARRVRDAVAMGYFDLANGTRISLRTPESVEILGHIVEANADSPSLEYFGFLHFVTRVMAGNSPRPASMHKILPSALEMFQTSLRDPVFYQLSRRYLTTVFERYESYLMPYTPEQISCPGVKVESVDVDKLVTYFEQFDTEITNGVYQKPFEKYDEGHLIIKARQERLNHMPFTVTTHLSSEKPTKVVFRYFLGPKYNGAHETMTINDNRHNFFQLDQFVYELKSGKNTVERRSSDFWYFDRDWTPSSVVYEELAKKEFTIGKHPEHLHFPQRLLLPAGVRGGMPFYFYVIVTPFEAPSGPADVEYPMIDQHLYGYPFDRPAVEGYFEHAKNMHFEEVMIFHKTEAEINKV